MHDCEWVDFGPDMDGSSGEFPCARKATTTVIVTDGNGEPMPVELCDKHAARNGEW